VVNEIQIPGKVLARITLQEQREIRDRIQKDRAKAVEEGIINEIAGSFTAIITQSLEQSGAHPSFVDRNVKTVFERATGGISDFFEELDKLISEFAEQFPDPMDFLDEFFHPPMPDISRK
jgi:adenine-specific DNA glycosylase